MLALAMCPAHLCSSFHLPLFGSIPYFSIITCPFLSLAVQQSTKAVSSHVNCSCHVFAVCHIKFGNADFPVHPFSGLQHTIFIFCVIFLFPVPIAFDVVPTNEFPFSGMQMITCIRSSVHSTFVSPAFRHKLCVELQFVNPSVGSRIICFMCFCNVARTTIPSPNATFVKYHSSARKLDSGQFNHHWLFGTVSIVHTRNLNTVGLSRATRGGPLVVLNFLDVQCPTLITRLRFLKVFKIQVRCWFPASLLLMFGFCPRALMPSSSLFVRRVECPIISLIRLPSGC